MTSATSTIPVRYTEPEGREPEGYVGVTVDAPHVPDRGIQEPRIRVAAYVPSPDSPGVSDWQDWWVPTHAPELLAQTIARAQAHVHYMSAETIPTAEEIAALRKSRGETQAEFGEAVGVWGDEHSRQVTVSRWERGEQGPSARYAHRIRELMGESASRAP